MDLKISIYQPAHKELAAKAYDPEGDIAEVTRESDPALQVLVYVFDPTPNHSVFAVISKRNNELVRQTSTTNYHKAIGLAVKLAME